MSCWKYRVAPTAEVEAVRYTSFDDVSAWLDGLPVYTRRRFGFDGKHVLVSKHDGELLHARRGDWIVIGRRGESFVVDDESFGHTYQEVD